MNDPLLAELQVHFRESTRTRIREMDESLAALERDGSDPAAKTILARHFHALAGMGGTYGFPSISTLGDEAEATMASIGGDVPAGTLRRWREIVREVEKEIES